MKSLFSALTAFALCSPSLAQQVARRDNSGTIKYTFERQYTRAKTPDLVTRQSVNALVTNENLFYVMNVTVGTPGQPLTLELTTGSSDTWFPASNSSICAIGTDNYAVCKAFGSYNQNSSSTYAATHANTPFVLDYNDGTSVRGRYLNDVLTIGSASLKNLTMAQADQAGQAFGIIGIGLGANQASSSKGFNTPTILDVMKSQGLINAAAFSLWLNDLNATTGSIIFGGVDPSKYSGPLTSVPLLLNSDYESSFAIAWTGLTISGSSQHADFSPQTVQTAVLSPGSSATFLPNSTVSAIYSGVGVTVDSTFGAIVPCNVSSEKLNFAFSFGGGGSSNRATIVVPLSEFVLPISASGAPTFGNGQKACYFGILAGGTGPAYFGDTFLRSAYVVYDLETLQIGLAQTKFGGSAGAGTGSVNAFTSGSGIPGASVTASSVSLGQTIAQPSTTMTSTSSVAAVSSGTFSLGGGSGSATATASSASATAHNGAGRVAGMDDSFFALLAMCMAVVLRW